MNKYILFAVLALAYFTAVSAATCPSGSTFNNCAFCDNSTTPSQCTSCNAGYGISGANGSQTCAACDPSCLNCVLANNSTQCIYSNDTTLATNTSIGGCAIINTTGSSSSYVSYQTYTASNFSLNSTTGNYTYSCFACPVNCTNCTLTNGSKPLSAVLNCTTCASGTGFVNSTTSSPYYGCFANGTTSGSTTGTSTSGSSTSGGSSANTRAATATCATTNSNGSCATCPSGYVPTTSGNTTICSSCAAPCVNCLAANDYTQCTYSNISAYNNASSSTPCASYSTQSYLAGAVNTTNYTYTCYACVFNCTDCTLSNGSKPVAAITTSCRTCANGTSLQSGTYLLNGVNVTGTACIYNTFSAINAGLTIGAIMTVLVSLLL